MKPLSDSIVHAPAGIPACIHEALHPVGCVLPGDLAAAEDWLRGQGCTRALGPMSGSTWLPYRANLGPTVEPVFHGEPSTAPETLLAAGYQPVSHYTSTACDHAPQIALADQVAPTLLAAGWRLGTLADLGEPAAALQALHSLVLAAFRDAFAYVPLHFHDFAGLYGGAGSRSDPALVLVAHAPDGTLGGLCFCFRDPLLADPARLVVKTLAVHPGWRRKGVGQWLVGEAHRVARARGYAYGIHALMWARSQSQRITAHGGRVVRRYALYGKDL